MLCQVSRFCCVGSSYSLVWKSPWFYSLHVCGNLCLNCCKVMPLEPGFKIFRSLPTRPKLSWCFYQRGRFAHVIHLDHTLILACFITPTKTFISRAVNSTLELSLLTDNYISSFLLARGIGHFVYITCIHPSADSTCNLVYKLAH